jgi:serine/threonine protein kinase
MPPPSPPPDLPKDTLASFRPTGVMSDSDVPILAVRSDDAVAAPAPPPFQLLRVIGEGGFGEVWEAVQTSLGRQVAVKKARRDLHEKALDDDSKARFLELMFRREALTTALLEHPNIVPVHELGLDENGRPMLAMKLVRGQPWSEAIYTDFPEMDPAEFLQVHLPVLVSLCQAVAFAHARGVVHRDLKPQQVMLGEFGEVLLMDWGLAVAFDITSLADRVRGPLIGAVPTLDSAVSPAGTVAFMAPEQTEERAQHVGPWTDVYLLGGILFYLLTGTPPHHSEDARQTFFLASRGEVEPAEERNARRRIPRELSAIAAKALSPRIDDRYASARAFMGAVQDYLTGATRRRESGELADAAAAAMAKPLHTYDDFHHVRELLNKSAALWPENPALGALNDRLYTASARMALARADLSLARAQAEHLAPGPDREALVAEATDAIERRRRNILQRKVATAATLLLVGMVAAVQWKANRDREAAQVRIMQERDAAMRERDLAKRARADADQLVAYVVDDMREKLVPIGRVQLLFEATSKAVDYFERLPEDQRDSATDAVHTRALRQLAMAQRDKGDLQTSLKTFRAAEELSSRALAKEPDSRTHKRDYAEALSRVGETTADLGNFTDARQPMNEALEILTKLAEANPEDLSLKRDVAIARERIGDMLGDLRDYRGALEQYATSRAIQQEMLLRAPENKAYREDFAICLARTGDAHMRLEEYEKARELYRQSSDAFSALLAEDPDNVRTMSLACNTLQRLGDACRGTREMEKAIEFYLQEVDLSRALADHDPLNVLWQQGLATSMSRLSTTYLAVKDLHEAERWALQGLELRRKLAARFPERGEFRYAVGLSLEEHGNVLRMANEFADALSAYQEAAAVLERLAAQPEAKPAWKREAAVVHEKIGNVYVDMKRDVEALASMKVFMDFARSTIETADDANSRRDYYVALNKYAYIATLLGRAAEGLPVAEEAMAAIDRDMKTEGPLAAVARESEPALVYTLMFNAAERGDFEAGFQWLARFAGMANGAYRGAQLLEDENLKKLHAADPKRFEALAAAPAEEAK